MHVSVCGGLNGVLVHWCVPRVQLHLDSLVRVSFKTKTGVKLGAVYLCGVCMYACIVCVCGGGVRLALNLVVSELYLFTLG